MRVGRLLFPLPTVIDIPADVVVFPLLSVAVAVSEWKPCVLVHEKLYGELVSSPTFVPSTRNSTFVTLPSLSLADAVMAITCPTVGNVAPFAGEEMLTVGGFPLLEQGPIKVHASAHALPVPGA